MSYKITINCLKFSYLTLFMLFLQTGYGQVSKKNTKEIGLNSYQDEQFFTSGEMVVHITSCDVCGYVHSYALVPTTRLVPNGYRITKDPQHPLL